MNLPSGTKYVYLAGAPGKGHKYELECYDSKNENRILLGSIGTTLSTIDKTHASGGHKLRCSGKWRWARVIYKNATSSRVPDFTLMVVPSPT